MKVMIDGVQYIPAPPAVTGKSFDAALDLRLDHAKLGDDITVREYLRQLVQSVWDEKESFDGKRPFGNSGWEFDIFFPLAVSGFIDLGPIHPVENQPYNWTAAQVNKAHAYVSDMITYAFLGGEA